MVVVLVALAFFAWLLHLANRRASKAGPVTSGGSLRTEPVDPDADSSS